MEQHLRGVASLVERREQIRLWKVIISLKAGESEGDETHARLFLTVLVHKPQAVSVRKRNIQHLP